MILPHPPFGSISAFSSSRLIPPPGRAFLSPPRLPLGSFPPCNIQASSISNFIRASPISNLNLLPSRLPLLNCFGGGSNGNINNGPSGNPSDNGDSASGFNLLPLLIFLCSATALFVALSAIAETLSGDDPLVVWEVRGLTKWTRFLADFSKDEFVRSPVGLLPKSEANMFATPGAAFLAYARKLCSEFGSLASQLMLPEGFPYSVTPDYLNYSLWRAVQGVASQINGVLATQALLFAVGLGKGAIPLAAAVNWVLKDGIGYLSKIMLSKYGRHFDVNPKGWRLFADLLENAAFGLEILTLGIPQFFVAIGVVAGASRSAAALIQAATRSYFFAGFAAQRNFAEVIAKGEAQGMVSKFVGIMIGIVLANRVGSSPSLALASFAVVAFIHMFCNVKSYQCVHLRTLNPYRASLVFSEYLVTGQAPPIKEVNEVEPLLPVLSFLNTSSREKEKTDLLSSEASAAAAELDQRLHLGSKLSSVVGSNDDATALLNLYKNESYILVERDGKFCVVMKEKCSASDLLKSVFQANYLLWLERVAAIDAKSTCDDCKPGGKLHMSLDYAQREFDHVKNDSSSLGWAVDGLIARPKPNRISVITH